MLLRKINNVKGERLRIGTMAIDPHGELVCLYEQERGEFLLVEIDDILKHFKYYRYSCTKSELTMWRRIVMTIESRCKRGLSSSQSKYWRCTRPSSFPSAVVTLNAL